MVSGDDVALGKVAFSPSAPRPNTRRIESGGKRGRTKALLGAIQGREQYGRCRSGGKRLFRKVYRNLNDWLGRRKGGFPGARVLPNADWFSPNPRGKIREIAAQILGISSDTVCKYWKEIQCGGGSSCQPNRAAPRRKAQRIWRLKDKGQMGGALCTT